MVAVFAFGAAGCGLFSSGDPAGEAKTGSLVITDKLNHEDPADIEFETRYALTTGKDSPELVEAFKADYGVDFVEMFSIIYANKDDKVVGEYDYYVFATAEDAQKFDEVMDAESRGGRVEDNVVCDFMNEETVNSIIAIDIQYNSLSDDSAKGYVELQKEANLMMNAE